MRVNLKDEKSDIIQFMKRMFETLNSLPQSIRQDGKMRTGIQVLVREPDTRNLIFFPIENPSEDAMFFSAEKAIRSHIMKDTSSENTSDPIRMRFAGSIGVYINEMYVQISISGMKAEEDVALGVRGLAYIFNTTPKNICKNVKSNGGKLPESFFQKDHYLNKFLGLN